MNRGIKSRNSSLSITNGSNGIIIIMDISKRNAYRVKTASIAMVTISTSNSLKFFPAADVLRRCMAAILSSETNSRISDEKRRVSEFIVCVLECDSQKTVRVP